MFASHPNRSLVVLADAMPKAPTSLQYTSNDLATFYGYPPPAHLEQRFEHYDTEVWKSVDPLIAESLRRESAQIAADAAMRFLLEDHTNSFTSSIPSSPRPAPHSHPKASPSSSSMNSIGSPGPAPLTSKAVGKLLLSSLEVAHESLIKDKEHKNSCVSMLVGLAGRLEPDFVKAVRNISELYSKMDQGKNWTFTLASVGSCKAFALTEGKIVELSAPFSQVIHFNAS